jgi:hypothetical protein
METDPIEKAIEQIRLLPNVRVDCGTAQGERTFFARLGRHISTPEMLDLPFDWYVTETDRCLAQIERFIRPCSLPADYLSFLKLHGGVAIPSTGAVFACLGFGPMSEAWYPYLAGTAGSFQNGFLKIASLRFRHPVENKFMYVFFFLDLGDGPRRGRVIGVSMWKLGTLGLPDVLREPQSCPACWSTTADSFTAWIQLAAATRGRFGYL